jgi:50S ribosomal subunit-associated GTPase HflX
MLPVWTQYLQDCKVLMYVIDVSDPVVLASAAMELFVLLSAAQLKDRPILVVLNKTDCADVMQRTEVDMSLQLREMPPHVKSRLSVLETSALEGTNTPEVLQWIRAHT